MRIQGTGHNAGGSGVENEIVRLQREIQAVTKKLEQLGKKEELSDEEQSRKKELEKQKSTLLRQLQMARQQERAEDKGKVEDESCEKEDDGIRRRMQGTGEHVNEIV